MTHLCAHVANLIFMDKNCLHVEANNYNVILIYLTKVLSSTYRVVVSYSSNLFIIICLGQSCKPFWIQFSAFGIQLIAIIFTKFSTKGVDSDDESTTIGFKLKPTTKMSSIVIIHLFCPYKFISVFLPNSNRELTNWRLSHDDAFGLRERLTAHAYLATCRRRAKVNAVVDSDSPAS